MEVEDVTRNEFCRSGNAPLDEVPLDGVAEMFVSEPKPTRAAKQVMPMLSCFQPGGL